jgi:hypothetical protein
MFKTWDTLATNLFSSMLRKIINANIMKLTSNMDGDNTIEHREVQQMPEYALSLNKQSKHPLNYFPMQSKV